MTTKDMMKNLALFTVRAQHLVLIAIAMFVVWTLKRMCYVVTMKFLMKYDHLSHKAERIVEDNKWQLLWKL
jgi:hypothetical protein